MKDIKLAMNLLMISTQKNLILSGRSFQTSPKTIRGRAMAIDYRKQHFTLLASTEVQDPRSIRQPQS